jgi:glycosyltransferase involved in cell wall biosynthesis
MNLRRSIAKRAGKIIGRDKVDPSIAPIFNVYNTSYDKTVLVSYITLPFRSNNHFMHQNFITSHIVAESFSKLGYNVDVIEYLDDYSVIDFDKYKVFFGMGIPFEKSFVEGDKKRLHIAFITGAHQDLHNKMALKSINQFYKLSELWLPAEASVSPESAYYGMFDSDASIILANGFIYDDYRSRYDGRLYSLNNNILGLCTAFKKKTISDRNKNILFLSGRSVIQKGLSHYLEVAKLRTDLNFYVVVPFIAPEFEDYYQDVLQSPNVFLFKNLSMDSTEMQQIIESCTYSVAPSYVDGFPGGTIEPMSAGLIPIVSRYCGFPAKDFIFDLEELTAACLNATINKVVSLDDEVYQTYSDSVAAYASKDFSFDYVKEELTNILTQEFTN